MVGPDLSDTLIEGFTSFDGLPLHCEYHSAVNARALCILLHGYGEHSGRYHQVIKQVKELGISVFSYDHRGHGRSGGRRALISDFDDLLEDLDLVLLRAKSLAPGLPFFLLGHSMGAVLASLYVITRRPHLAGLILSALAVRPLTKVPPVVQAIGRLLGRIVPSLPTVDLGLAALIARDPVVVAAYGNDPLNYLGKILARTGAEIQGAGNRVLAEADQIRCPLLVMHGGADQIADLAGAEEVFAAAISPDKTMKVYPGAFHEIFNDFGKAAVLADLQAWLQQQLG